jgi:hypothetical protein
MCTSRSAPAYTNVDDGDGALALSDAPRSAGPNASELPPEEKSHAHAPHKKTAATTVCFRRIICGAVLRTEQASARWVRRHGVKSSEP